MSWRRVVGLALSVAAAAAFGATASAPAATRRLSVVQLGDSVASGEGTLYGYRYDTKAQTWTGGNLNVTWPGPYPDCHVSPDAYGDVVARGLGATFTTFACTGASYANGDYRPRDRHGAARDDDAAAGPVRRLGERHRAQRGVRRRGARSRAPHPRRR